MHNPLSQPAPARRDFDDELVLTFLSQYQSLDRALVRAGYVRAGRTPGSRQADWAGFVRHIEKQFDPDASPVLQGAVSYLLCNEDSCERRDERIENAHPWEYPDLANDTIWLSELVQQTGVRLIHDLNFPGGPVYDLSLISAAMFVVDAWSHLDPKVEGLLSGL